MKTSLRLFFVAILVLVLPASLVFAQDTTPTRDNNMGMGNPTGATTTATDSDNYLVVKPQYALSYNNSKGMANWVSWHLSAAWRGTSGRCNCFNPDSTLPTGYFRAATSNYTGTGFDRGHLCPSDDRTASDTDNAATFKMTNISPQAPVMNEQTWGYLEDYCRSLITQGKEMYIIAGGYGSGGSGSTGGTTSNIDGAHINVPAYFWKIILVLPVDSNDVARVTTSTRVIAVLMPNTQSVNAHTWDYYRVSVDSIQTLTGYNFFSNVDTSIQEVIEARVDDGSASVLAWDFSGANNVATWGATTINSHLDVAGGAANLTRGSTAASSTGANSFRTTGFKNDGIATSNTDYYQAKLKAANGYILSLSSLDATFAGTATFCASPGVSAQFAYSLDGTSYTLIGLPFVAIGTPNTISTVDLTGISALQNIPSSQTVYLRYYASGQTTTGGWGFYSSDTGNNGIAIGGSLSAATTGGTITGGLSVCPGSSTTLADTAAGGSWASGNTGVAIVGSGTGVVTGVAAGTAVISYTTTLGTATATFTVNAIPAAITGAATVCVGTTTTLSDATGGGLWASSNAGVAGIGSATGVVTGVAAGTAIVTYTAGTGCIRTTTETIGAMAAITGGAGVCLGQNLTLGDAATGGIWSSTNPLIARVGSLTGVVAGVASGTTNITYTIGSCRATLPFAVGTLGAISGPGVVCAGQTTNFGNATSGGFWTSSVTGTAMVGSSTGVVSGVSAGTAIISYALGTGCTVTKSVAVNALAPISGPASVCVGQTISLADAAMPGTWASSNATLASVGSSGIVAGVSGGAVTITYTIGGCKATMPVTVNRLSPISGAGTVCASQATTLTNTDGGGIWASSNTGTATIGSATAFVTGVSVGTATISYTLATGCTATRVETVNPLAAITGPSSLCISTPITLADAVTGGSWTSGNATIARVGSLTGVVTGVRGGFATITYTIAGTGCKVTAPVTVSVCRLAETATAAEMGVPPSLTVIPNPNTGDFLLKGILASGNDEEMEVEVINAVGQVVYKSKAIATGGAVDEHIQLSGNLPSGLYLLHYRAENADGVIHFVIGR